MMHYKKNGLLWQAKNAAKTQKSVAKCTFDLQRWVLLWWFFPPLLRCCYRSIAAVTKNASINLPFSEGFGLVRRADNYRHIRLEFESIDLQWWYMCTAIGDNLQRQVISAAIGLHIEHNICTFQQQLQLPLYV